MVPPLVEDDYVGPSHLVPRSELPLGCLDSCLMVSVWMLIPISVWMVLNGVHCADVFTSRLKHAERLQGKYV